VGSQLSGETFLEEATKNKGILATGSNETEIEIL